MKNIPDRNSEIYTNVEKFKRYEHTNCIAYEMAIRNKENINSIKNFLRKHISKSFNKKYADIFCELEMNCSYLEELRKAFINYEQLYLKYPWFNDLNEFIDKKKKQFIIERDKKLHNEINERIKKFTDEIKNKKIEIDEELKEIINHEKQYEIFKKDDNHIAFIDAIIFKKQISNFNDEISSILDIDDEKIYIQETKTKYFHYDTSYKIKNDSHEILKREIKPNYERPILIPYFFNNKVARLEINLALPIEDLNDMVEKLKNEFTYKNNSMLSANEFENKKSTLNDNEIKKILNNPSKVADLLYIYDCLESDMTYQEIKSKLYSYYNKENKNNNKTFDDKTIKTYKETALEYIEKKRYKELISIIKF